MILTSLNMLNVHPIFRYFAVQPPKFITRFVRNQVNGQDAFAPIVLGLMTVLIPCGTTQAMEVLAISTATPWLGALIMFLFVLGTSPTFLFLVFWPHNCVDDCKRGLHSSLPCLYWGWDWLLLTADSNLSILRLPLAV